MKIEDWINLDRLSVLFDANKLLWMGRSNYFLLLHQTEGEHEHPDEYEGPCLCYQCCLYE